MPPLPPLIALVGATAVGKTTLGIELARRLSGEIISADSRQVYRQMEIGTAAPTSAERAAAPHHLVAIVEPDEDFSLATYQERATAAIADVTMRGRVPLLVGGTGQYLAAVLQGWQIPRVPPQPEIRTRLEQEAREQGTAALHARLAQIDPQAAANISADNVRRVIRALEVFLITGKPISHQQTRQPPAYHMTTLWLTMPRETLYARIDARVDNMMQAGLLEEVHSLIAQGYSWNLPAMSGLGYRQFRPYFMGTATLDECVQRLKYDTHAFARRQANWFRRLPGLVQLIPV